MGAIRNFLLRFKAGDPVAKVCSVSNANRIANILEDLQGIGCRIAKPTDAEGKGWKIIIDGSSDLTPPGYEPPYIRGAVPAGGTQYQVLQKVSADDYDVAWDWMRYVVPA